MLIGYCRCSTDTQDLTAQHDGLTALGVKANRIYVDHGLTGRNRDRPGTGASHDGQSTEQVVRMLRLSHRGNRILSHRERRRRLTSKMRVFRLTGT